MKLSELQLVPKTYWLMLLLLAIFIVQIAAAAAKMPFTEYLMVYPGAVLKGQMLWGIFTNIFLHAGFSHLFFNCFALFFFGLALERLVGWKNMLLVFLVSGLFASIFYVFTSVFLLGSATAALGASGAIYGLIGAMVVLRPHTKVMMLFAPVPTDLWIVAIFFILIAVIWFGIGGATGVAENAHLGGLIIGLILGWYYKKKEQAEPDFDWKTFYQ